MNSQQKKNQKTQNDRYSNLEPKKNPADPDKDPIRNPENPSQYPIKHPDEVLQKDDDEIPVPQYLQL